VASSGGKELESATIGSRQRGEDTTSAGGGVRLSPLGTSVTICPVVPR
jgi:hypothetical protein